MRLTSTTQGRQHHVTIPQHRTLRVGTLRSILGDVASSLDKSVQELQDELFG